MFISRLIAVLSPLSVLISAIILERSEKLFKKQMEFTVNKYWKFWVIALKKYWGGILLLTMMLSKRLSSSIVWKRWE